MEEPWINQLLLLVACTMWVVCRARLASLLAAARRGRSVKFVPPVPASATTAKGAVWFVGWSALACGLAISSVAEAQQSSAQAASALLQRAVNAVGGTTALQNITSMKVQAQGDRWVLDEGFLPGMGASGRSTFTLQLVHDLAQDRLRLDYDLAGGAAGARQVSEVLVGNLGYIQGQDGAGQPNATRAMLTDRWASIRAHQFLLNPLLLLRELANDPSALENIAVDVQGGLERVLIVNADPAPLRLHVDLLTGRLVKLVTMESDPLRRDVPLEIRYGDWRAVTGGVGVTPGSGLPPDLVAKLSSLLPTHVAARLLRNRDNRDNGSVQYPARIEVLYDGEQVHAETRTVEINAPVDPNLFVIPEGISPTFDPTLAVRGEVSHQHLQSFAAYGFPREGLQPQVVAREVAPNVFLLGGGSHNSLAVVQENGVVIVEAPLDEVRSGAVLDWVEANVPGKAVTHVVMSHHHADHSAGLRTYVAAGAVVVMGESAVAFFRDVFTAPSEVIPDALALNPRLARIEPVSSGGTVTLPDAANPVSVAPIVNTHAADAVIVNGGGVVFVVDLYSPFPGATQLPPGAQLLQQRIVELGWQPVAIAGGHGGSIAYDDFTALLGP